MSYAKLEIEINYYRRNNMKHCTSYHTHFLVVYCSLSKRWVVRRKRGEKRERKNEK